jgi:hypothetical protein
MPTALATRPMVGDWISVGSFLAKITLVVHKTRVRNAYHEVTQGGRTPFDQAPTAYTESYLELHLKSGDMITEG